MGTNPWMEVLKFYAKFLWDTALYNYRKCELRYPATTRTSSIALVVGALDVVLGTYTKFDVWDVVTLPTMVALGYAVDRHYGAPFDLRPEDVYPEYRGRKDLPKRSDML